MWKERINTDAKECTRLVGTEFVRLENQWSACVVSTMDRGCNGYHIYDYKNNSLLNGCVYTFSFYRIFTMYYFLHMVVWLSSSHMTQGLSAPFFSFMLGTSPLSTKTTVITSLAVRAFAIFRRPIAFRLHLQIPLFFFFFFFTKQHTFSTSL